MSRTPGAVVLLLVIATAAYGCVAFLVGRFGVDLLPDNGLARIVAVLGSPWAALGGALLFWRRGPVWEEQLHGPFREGPGAARRRTMRSGKTQTPGSGQARRIAVALAVLGGLTLLVQYSGSAAGVLLPVALVGGLVLAGRAVLARAGSGASWRGLLHSLAWWRRGREEEKAEPGADDPYREALRIFGLSDGYTKEELQARYRELHKRVHPDTGGSTAFAQQLNAAYDLLKRRRRWR